MVFLNSRWLRRGILVRFEFVVIAPQERSSWNAFSSCDAFYSIREGDDDVGEDVAADEDKPIESIREGV